MSEKLQWDAISDLQHNFIFRCGYAQRPKFINSTKESLWNFRKLSHRIFCYSLAWFVYTWIMHIYLVWIYMHYTYLNFGLVLARRNLTLVMLMFDIAELTIRRIGRFNLRDESRLSTVPNYFDISFYSLNKTFLYLVEHAQYSRYTKLRFV